MRVERKARDYLADWAGTAVGARLTTVSEVVVVDAGSTLDDEGDAAAT